MGIQLKNIMNLDINRGIITGFNEAFIIDEKTKNELLIKISKFIKLLSQFYVERILKDGNSI